MKKGILIGLLAVTLFTACGQADGKKDGKESVSTEIALQTADESVVTVYYFHGKQRCKTCVAVGDIAGKTIRELYADNPKVLFIEIDTTDEQYASLVEKYEVTWNALIIAQGDKYVDITQEAFANALNSPDELTQLLEKHVNDYQSQLPS